MTKRRRDIRLLVYKHDEVWADPLVPEVEWTFGDDVISDEELTIGGQVIRVTAGRTESRPWNLVLTDAAETITQKLADANGRAHMLFRLARVEFNDDLGGGTPMATARITDVNDAGGTGYTFTFEDERIRERRATIFTQADSTQLYPAGLIADYMDIVISISGDTITSPAYPVPHQFVGEIAASVVLEVESVDRVLIEMWRFDPLGRTGSLGNVFREEVSDTAVSIVKADLVAELGGSQGNFVFTRFHDQDADADREIVSFGQGLVGGQFVTALEEDVDQLRYVHLFWPGHGKRAGDPVNGYLYAPGRPPDNDLPLHIAFHEAGSGFEAQTATKHSIDPFQLVLEMYRDGRFQDPAEPIQTVRFNPTAFSLWDPVTNPKGLIKNPRFALNGIGWRISKSHQILGKWIEDNIYAPLGVVPFIDAEGRVDPRPITLPTADEIDLATLPNFSDATVADGGEGWRHPSREIVTRVVGTFLQENNGLSLDGSDIPTPPPHIPGFPGIPGGPPPEGFSTEGELVTAGLDNLVQRVVEISFDHDLIDRFGVETLRFTLPSHERSVSEPLTESLARDMLQRFGDGPQWTILRGMFATELPEPGDFVKVTATQFPKLHQVPPTRSDITSRIGQIVQKVFTEVAPNYVILDVGADLQPLTTPGVTCALNSGNSDWVDVTVTGLVAGATYRLEFAIGDTIAQTDAPWQLARVGTDADSFPLIFKNLPRGAKVHWRAQQFVEGRVMSEWSPICIVTIATLVTPLNCAIEVVTSSSGVFVWTPQESEALVQISLNGIIVATRPAGTITYTFNGLQPETLYTAGVRHIDLFGGISAFCTADFFTDPTSVDPTCIMPDLIIDLANACS